METPSRTPTASSAPSRRARSFTAVRRRPKRRRSVLNAVAVAITAAIVLACAVWIYGVRIYDVSSNSMAPTFLGIGEDRDRILCWMLSRHYRSPERWEPIVFHTPAKSESQTLFRGFSTAGEKGVTIKRLVGLPGEELAIAGGDIWTRPLVGGDFVRQVKPEKLQRQLWIGVYDENFSDVSLEEFLFFWHPDERDGLSISPEDGLRMAGGSGIRYIPRSRNTGNTAPELPGIPDRYVLPQEIIFLCTRPECGHSYGAHIDNQKIQARCPVCGKMNFEDSVDFYGFRAGIPETGEYSPGLIKQLDEMGHRDGTYNFVSDLRVVLEIKLESAGSVCGVTLSDDNSPVVLAVGTGGVSIEGRGVPGVSGLPAGEWARVEFHRADGRVRLYMHGGEVAVYDELYGSQMKPDVDFGNVGSGVGIYATGGGVRVRVIGIDRDIHYYSGHKMAIMNYFAAMDNNGSIVVPEGSFFPLGDNTTVSLDGRSWGAIDESLLMGTAAAIWRPASRRRLLIY